MKNKIKTNSKSTPKIFIRNFIIFLMIYIIMMGVMTISSAIFQERAMYEKACNLISATNNYYDYFGNECNPDDYEIILSPEDPEAAIVLEDSSILDRTFAQSYLANTMLEAANDNIYLRTTVYNSKKEVRAKSGNMLFFDGYDGEYVSTKGFLNLDDYMSIEEINSFFSQVDPPLAHSNLIQVKGVNTPNGIIPEEIRLYADYGLFDINNRNNPDYFDPDTNEIKIPPVAVKNFGKVSGDSEFFGSYQPVQSYFERVINRGFFRVVSGGGIYFDGWIDCGEITQQDQERYAYCDEIAETSTNKFLKSILDEPGSVGTGFWRRGLSSSRSGWFFVDEDISGGYISIGVQYFPLEITAYKLIPIYILFAVLFFIIYLIFSIANFFVKKARALENARKSLTIAVAHELKTPLGIIRNYGEGLKENINEEKREHYLDMIIDETGHMDEMVLEMLAFSQIESGQKLSMTKCSLKEMTEDALNGYQALIDKKGITASLQCGGDALIKCDRKWITMVISNFISNAVEHTPDGGSIDIEITSRKKKTLFEIKNTGERIPSKKLPHIWGAYYKTDGARSNSRSSGLGLSLAKNILTLHKFKYGAENRESGVTFWFKAK